MFCRVWHSAFYPGVTPYMPREVIMDALIRITEEQSLPRSDTSRNASPVSVCLVTALTVADFIDPELTTSAQTNTGAQLGVLTLAAILRDKGFDPHIVNVDDLFVAFLEGIRNESTRNVKLELGHVPEAVAKTGQEPAQPGNAGSFL